MDEDRMALILIYRLCERNRTSNLYMPDLLQWHKPPLLDRIACLVCPWGTESGEEQRDALRTLRLEMS